MKRFHLIEIHEQPWCPAAVRDAVTDFLQFSINFNRAYQPIFPRLRKALEETKARRVVDLCSGGGGPWPGFKEELGADYEIVLTDFYPNLTALRELKNDHDLDFQADSVNALAVPENLAGFRTMFSAFHHFRPAHARQILRNAAENDRGIGIFEGTPRSPKTLLLMFLTPLVVLLLTPKIRPFRWSRIVFTYLIPVVPLVVLFDGLVSVLRTYTPAELRSFISEIDRQNYVWETGEQPGDKNPIPVVYLIGRPK